MSIQTILLILFVMAVTAEGIYNLWIAYNNFKARKSERQKREEVYPGLMEQAMQVPPQESDQEPVPINHNCCTNHSR